MQKYVFYDKKTGEIVHTHRVYKFDSEKLEKVSKKELMESIGRKSDRKELDVCTVTIPEQSSKSALISINPKTKKPLIKKLPRDYWKKIEAERIKKNESLEGGIG